MSHAIALFAVLAGLVCTASAGVYAGSITVNEMGSNTQYSIIQRGGTDGKVSVSGTQLRCQKDSRMYFGQGQPDSFGPNIFKPMDLLGKKLGYTIDVSKIGCSCNAAVYMVTMPGKNADGSPALGEANDYYCDANNVGGVWCPEIDLAEANTHALAATPHKCDPPDGVGRYTNCDKGGAGTNAYRVDNSWYGPGKKIDTSREFEQVIEFIESGGQWSDMRITLTQGSNTVSWTITEKSGQGSWYMNQMTDALKKGFVLVISNWGVTNNGMSWLDQPPCDASLKCNYDEWFTVKDIWLGYNKPSPVQSSTPVVDSSSTGGGGNTGKPYTPKAKNPYEEYSKVYINPDYIAEVESSIAKHPALKCKFEKVATYPTFIWLDNIAKIDTLEGHMQRAKSQGSLVQLVIYDLPNRDCAAAASNGELTVSNDGLNKYKTQYIDVIANILDKYPTVPVVMVIEPDSLPNMVTNMNIDKCSQAATAYKQGTAYAISKLAGALRWMYIDAAHECWLGWTTNLEGFPKVIEEMMALATDTSSVRGFASNTANYQNVHLAAGNQGCGDSNPILDNAAYVKAMSEVMVTKGVFKTAPLFVIDTSRNGAKDTRSKNANWCNIKNTGLGARPKAGGDGQVEHLDAFVWVKTPGESDGTSDSSAQRYDFHCTSDDSLPNAPQAGQWFDSQFMYLVGNATPAVVADSSCTQSSPLPFSSVTPASSGQNPGKTCSLSLPTTASGFGSCSSSVDAGESCSLKCKSGYSAEEGTCSSSGSWSPKPTCVSSQVSSGTQDVSCMLSLPDTADDWGTCSDSVPAGATCTLQCSAGNSATQGKCTSSGQWSPRPRCGANAASSFGPVVAFVLACFAALLVQ